MSRFIDEAIARAGLGEVIPARTRGDLKTARELINVEGRALDLLIVGAVADRVRALENGDVVRIHPSASEDVHWVSRDNELELLRAVAVARAVSEVGAKIGVDWGKHGLELAQVALGFGATDLCGPITRKNGVVIREDEKKKVKGLGMVESSALKRREIAALVRNAGRECEFTDEEEVTTTSRKAGESEIEAAHA